MKLVAIFLVATVACASAIKDDEVLQKWTEFQTEYGKSYRSPVEATKRLSIFKDNLEQIDAHNERFNQGEVSYQKGINQFSDWTKDEFLEYVNRGLSGKPNTEGTIFSKSENFVAGGSVDWRNQNAVTGVKNQGQCGSCWAFSTTGGLEGQLGIVQRNLISLSEQELVDCSSEEGNGGCNGGLMTEAFEYVQQNGLASEADYAYEAQDGYCRNNVPRALDSISGYVNIPEGDEASLQEAISNVGPVSIAIDATAELQQYRSGILDDYSCNSYSLNHGVLAVGYGSENGQAYYIIKNSWGASWGESGYFRLPRDAGNKCGVASSASYPQL